ncbi:MAG: efflux RND transporter periplasmic adaptor subunit [Caulobacterales bacterium]
MNQVSGFPPSDVIARPAPATRPAGASKPRLRLGPWIVVAVLLALAVGAGAWWRFGRQPSVHYVAASVQRGAVTRSVTASGMVNPVLTVLVGAYVSGTIQDIYCDFNTRVRKGQICARIDPRPYQIVVDQDAAALGTAQAQLVKDKAALTYANLANARSATLLAQKWLSQDAADQARSVRDQAAAQVGLDQAAVTQHAAALKAAKINLGYANIVSPVDGTVVSRNVTQGQTVAASFQTPTLFLIATDLTRMQVDANVSESDIGGGLAVGDGATFTVDAFPDRVFHATVSQIRQAPQAVQNVVTYDVVLAVDNADLALKPGMTATSRIITAQHVNVLRVPNQALRYRPGGLGAAGSNPAAPAKARSSPRIWVLREGKPVRIAVKTGLQDETNTEITSDALQAGDQVITAETGGPAASGGARTPLPRF